MYKPLFLKINFITSYRRTVIFIVIFLLGFIGPILLIPQETSLDRRINIFEDILMWTVPILLLISVYFLNSILDSLYNLMPMLDPKVKSEIETRKNNQFKELFTPTAYRNFEEIVKKWMFSKFELIAGGMTVLIGLLVAFDNWWTFDGLYYYEGLQVFPYTDISVLVLLFTGLFLGLLASSALWHIMVFVIALSLIKRIVRPETLEKDFLTNLNIIQIDLSNSIKGELSYSSFKYRFQFISDFVFQVFFKLFIIALFLIFMFLANQQINFGRVLGLSLNILIIINIVIFLNFILVQIRFRGILLSAKLNIISNLEKIYSNYMKNLLELTLNVNSDIAQLKILEQKINGIHLLIAKESKKSPWAFNLTFISGVIVPIIIAITIAIINKSLDIVIEFLNTLSSNV
ncbi:MAG: hypothetical protein HeimC3_25150 [Candidatus Heimdallarchaeota archaeon LC_3]|nr:MAG: hypothetical protein HeimC3_25150 [Candidatus Heimdallarchaeota archaeon LC_3]